MSEPNHNYFQASVGSYRTFLGSCCTLFDPILPSFDFSVFVVLNWPHAALQLWQWLKICENFTDWFLLTHLWLLISLSASRQRYRWFDLAIVFLSLLYLHLTFIYDPFSHGNSNNALLVVD